MYRSQWPATARRRGQEPLIDGPRLPPYKQGLRKRDSISYGMRGLSESEETEAMAQHMKVESTPARSRAWLEAECLAVAKRTRGGKDIERVMIRRLNPKGA